MASVHVELVDSPIEAAINIDSFLQRVTDPDVGAIGWFLGVTRRTTGNRITETLSYEAHRPMATQELSHLANAAAARFSLTRVVIVHRLGEVPVGQASVLVGCSSPHRGDTFAALPWMMDELKRNVPIWKRESYIDGTTEWIHPTDS